jgi:molybdopterin-biosynthesis enzyme MoeA-like protein
MSNGSAPAFYIENVFVLPGIPSYVELMLPQLKKVLVSGKKIISLTCDAKVRESSIALDLKAIQNKYPEIDIGSYPYSKEGGFGTMLVMRSHENKLLSEYKKYKSRKNYSSAILKLNKW